MVSCISHRGSEREKGWGDCVCYLNFYFLLCFNVSDWEGLLQGIAQESTAVQCRCNGMPMKHGFVVVDCASYVLYEPCIIWVLLC